MERGRVRDQRDGEGARGRGAGRVGERDRQRAQHEHRQRCRDEVGPGRAEPVDGGGEEVEQGRLGAPLLFDLFAHPAAPATGSPTASVIVPSRASTTTVSPSPTSPESTFSASGFSTSRCTVRLSGRAPYAGS